MGEFAEFGNELSCGDFEVVDQDEMLIALANQLHDFGLHNRTADHGDRAADIDERSNSKFGVDVARGAEAVGDRDDWIAIDGRSDGFVFLTEEAGGIAFRGGKEPAGERGEQAEKRTASPVKFRIHARCPLPMKKAIFRARL